MDRNEFIKMLKPKTKQKKVGKEYDKIILEAEHNDTKSTIDLQPNQNSQKNFVKAIPLSNVTSHTNMDQPPFDVSSSKREAEGQN